LYRIIPQGSSLCDCSHRGRMPKDAARCSGALSFDDRNIGLNNQLGSLSYMLCIARSFNACVLHVPPLGYHACGAHLPGRTLPNGSCSRDSSSPAGQAEALSLLRLPGRAVPFTPTRTTGADDGTAWTAVVLGGGLGGHGRATTAGACQAEELAKCTTCSHYNSDPYACVLAGLRSGARVFMSYAYGLRVKGRHPRAPPCMGSPLQVQLSSSVEAYTGELMQRLQLRRGRFVAAQLRAGLFWQRHVEAPHVRAPWACYGMRTINRTLSRLLGQAEASSTPLFLLTNLAERRPVGLHPPTVSLPLSVLAETRVVSLAHVALLNPISSFKETVRALRGGCPTCGVVTVAQEDVVQGDKCWSCGKNTSSVFDEDDTRLLQSECRGTERRATQRRH
jgi:hypothetical protein